MPDRPGGIRPTGAVRSVPTPERQDNAYTTTLSKEKSWGRGLAILWVLFLLVMSVDLRNADCYCTAGKVGWPLPADVARIGLFCTAFIALWSGLGLTRYLLVLVSFLAGVWLWVDCTLSYRAYPQLMATGSANWTVYATVESVPKIAVGLFCIVLALYVLFSDDVREFVAHRRRRGRVWSALLSAVVVYGLMLAVFAVPLAYGKVMQAHYADAQRFGEETLHAMSEHWDPAALDQSLDPAYAKTFTKADRAATFGNFKYLGLLKNANTAPAVARAPLPQYPLQDKVPIPQGITSAANKYGTGFEETASYATTGAEFEHGKAKFGFDLVRDLGGLWRITKLNVENVQYDKPPAPAPTPAPDASPAPADGAMPASPPAVTPAATVAPTPLASATPAPSVIP